MCVSLCVPQVVCLLADTLSVHPAAAAGIHHVRVDWVVGQGRGTTGAVSSQQAQQRKIGQFRLQPSEAHATRLLVSTTVLAEGIDVPSCDAVVRFWRPTGTVENTQSQGRAREVGSTYVEMLATHETSGVEVFRRFEQLLVSELQQREELVAAGGVVAGVRPEAPSPAAVPYDKVEAHPPLCVESTGACLPVEMAVEVLKTEVYCLRLPACGDDDNGDFELDYTGSGRHFSDKEEKHGYTHFHVREIAQGQFVCTITLERVCLCSMQVRLAL